MNARSVFDAMLAKYAAARSYQDQGVVLTKWPDETEPNEIVFATFFRRPDRFRFEWTRHHPYPPLRHLKNHHVIWFDGAHAFSYNDHDAQVEPQESLAIAVAGATGISKGSALTVSNLLMPLIDAVSISELQELDLREHSFEGTRCYCIRGRDSRGDQHEVCIGIEDYLLRSISASRENGIVSREIRREPRVNHLIDEHVFTSTVKENKPHEAV